MQRRLAEKLKQSAGEQTLRMVAAILTSAFVFHASIEGPRRHSVTVRP